MRIEVSGEIDRPVSTVFHFFADEHVSNHPRWDPAIELWMDQPEPIRLGTIIRRRNRRSGSPVEGTMEVVEYEPNLAFGTLIREGAAEIASRATFEPAGPERTRLTISADMPIDPAMKDRMTAMIQGSLGTIRQLVETASPAPAVSTTGPS